MSLHFAPFLAGMAVGAVVTYLLKDEKAKNTVQSGIRKTGATLNSGVEKVVTGAEKVVSGVEKVASGMVSKDDKTSQITESDLPITRAKTRSKPSTTKTTRSKKNLDS